MSAPGLSLERLRGIVQDLRKHSIRPRRITLAEARTHNCSLNRNRIGRKYPRWYLLPGTPCYTLRHTKRRSFRKTRR